LACYWACAITHVVAVALDLGPLRALTKATLMPILASWTYAQEGPTPITAALLASSAGDILMELGMLLPAMAMYATAHACYVAVFATDATRRPWRVIAMYAALGAIVLALLWSGLGVYRIPVASYALMLAATAVSSLWYGDRAGLGGALFLISDSCIGARLAGHDFPGRDFLVMLTYGVGQYNLAAGALRGPRPALPRRQATLQGSGLPPVTLMRSPVM
jgi:uncharacterized membrane protein YhhN